MRLNLLLVIFCFAFLLPTFAQTDLTQAVIVAPTNFSAPENKAVQMLIEEIEKAFASPFIARQSSSE